MATTKELVKTEPNGIIPFDQETDYPVSVSKTTGMEGLGKDDFKTPRIILLQGLSPELGMFEDVAKKDQFWHNGMNVSLGEQFIFVPVVANKRVILWRPRNDQDGGILAFSKNGKNWDSGANQTFKVKIRNKKEPVEWRTGKDVLSSRLTEFGTSNPDESQSAPAASIVYEYLCYLPDHPELSPCVLGVSKTALPNGKAFNTSLAMWARQGKPIQMLGVRCFVEETSNSEGTWTIPKFNLEGKVQKDVYEIAAKMAESYSDYNVEYKQEETVTVDDEIKY